MKYFNVPADFKNNTIDQYDKLNDTYKDSRVTEIYGQITVENIFGSGRPCDMIPKVNMNTLEKHIKYARQKNIDFSYTLNATCLGNKEFTEEGMAQIGSFLDRLYEIGVTSLTIAIPSLIEFVKLSKYKFTLKASTLCNIINANKAMGYKNLGADRIVVHESINRDFSTLKNIRETFGERVEIIVNVICHKNCIFRPFHQNQGSHDIDIDCTSTRYYPHRCMMKRIEGIENYLQMNWVRPEDIKYYTDIGIKYFKVQGRHTVERGNPAKTIECYMKESFDGNLLDLLDNFSNTTAFKIHIDNKKLDGYIDPFYKNPNFCKNYCQQCGYCVKYAKKSIDSQKAEDIFRGARAFYGEFDQYNKMIENYNRDKQLQG
ncbi:U32 family peptidase [Wukongibacter sp. M2B1]|uniref:U32 family peptidase n=1 Tax=Wukongibacter sp. M2B1 TaxID=3088895 RepID=UPI003D7C09DB